MSLLRLVAAMETGGQTGTSERYDIGLLSAYGQLCAEAGLPVAVRERQVAQLERWGFRIAGAENRTK